MLDCNRCVKKKFALLTRIVAVLLPVVCVLLLLTQTAFAKNTYFINDGGRVIVHTTYATDPATVLDEAGLQLNNEDTYTTSVGIGVSEITVQRKQTVSIVCGGRTMTVTSYGESVESLLNRLNVTLTKDDVLSTTLHSKTYDGMVLSISRNFTEEETYVVAIPHNVEYCYDASLSEGEEKVLTPGRDGQIQCVASVCYVDGVEVSRTILEQKVISQPVDAVIAIGTATTAVPDVTPEAPDAPAKPIIGDGIIITPNGETLTYTSSKKMVATAYTNTDPGCTIWTAIGTYCRVGAIAVDPKVIPYGTRMYIVSDDGRYIYGIAVAEDCGKSIKGDRIDLYFDTDAECWTFGIRSCTVYFLG